MGTEAFFTGIREQIIAELAAAQDSVLVAVAWLTDRELFDALVSCQRRGVAVSLAVLDDRINRKSSIAWERLTALGGKHYWIPDGTNRAGSLHHKFCLIDNDTVINGSFNWTNRASSADENIVVMKGDSEFADQFRQAFERLLDKHGHDVDPTPIDRVKLMTRLMVISKLLELDDHDDIPAQAKKLEQAKGIPEVSEIMDLLQGQLWAQALLKVKDVLTRGLAIAVYEDPRINDWRWQVQLMEAQVLALEAELAEMQRQVHLFDCKQEEAIGDLIREYLDVKRRVLDARYKKNGGDFARQEAEAAESTYEEYEQARAEQENEPKPQQLDEAQQTDLKTLFRKLARLCHPDHMPEETKRWATEKFKAINDANRRGDIDAMRRLQAEIESGPIGTPKFVIPDDADVLQSLLASLTATINQLHARIFSIVGSTTWKVISQQQDLTVWFQQQGDVLKSQIRELKSELNAEKELST